MYGENFLSLKRDRIKGGAYFCKYHSDGLQPGALQHSNLVFEMLLLFLGSAIAQRGLSLHPVLNQHMENVDPLR